MIRELADLYHYFRSVSIRSREKRAELRKTLEEYMINIIYYIGEFW